MPNPIRQRRLGGDSHPNIATLLKRSSSQRWLVADNAVLSQADNDFTLCGFFSLNSVGLLQGLCCKGTSSTATTEWVTYVDSSNLFHGMISSPSGSNSTDVTAANFGALALNTWYFGHVVHDSVANTVTVGVNLVTNQNAFSSGMSDTAQDMYLGCFSSLVAHLDGRLDCWFCWKGRALSLADLGRVYKGGMGSALRDLPGDLLASLIFAYDFDGNGLDGIGTNHLTAQNGPVFAAGKR